MTNPTLTPEQHAALRAQHEAIRYTLALMQINALCVEHCREEAPDRAELALQRIKGYVEQTNADLTLFWDQISALLGIAHITPTA